MTTTINRSIFLCVCVQEKYTRSTHEKYTYEQIVSFRMNNIVYNFVFRFGFDHRLFLCAVCAF
ncbi:ORF33 [Leucania separata nucleopolyhedrovirus]|uniref:ORF33 n=1 Tax=Leucania separata nucleopolyhedrovirus TaxID=1307956 RepID=Q0IL86_NPVLS|nr:ORF33 [Leucania separata nucleopolyhedrovirus]AAR28797.1 ORF33 [Leucania separata nucleopolyhedrovirus]